MAIPVVALAAWFTGHLEAGLAPVGQAAWTVLALLIGVLRPKTGLLLTILVVPFTGGALDPARGELLRVLPVLSAAGRILADRVAGRGARWAPSLPMVGIAAATVALLLGTGLTVALRSPDSERVALEAWSWLLGGPAALVAAWLVASHVSPGEESSIRSVVLVSTVAACCVALASWIGVPWTDPFVFQVSVSGRLAALGFAPPTGLALAFAAPLAIAAARRYHLVAAIAVGGLAIATIILTGSRGPLIALGIGALAALALGRRLTPRRLALGFGLAAIVGSALIATRYPGASPAEIVAWTLSTDGGDAYRIRSWIAAIAVAIEQPLTGGGWRSLANQDLVDVAAIADSHNVVLWGLANGGLPLAAGLALLLGYAIRGIWIGRRVHPGDFVAAAVALLVAGLWDIPHVRSYGAVMGGLALGLVSRRVSDLPDEPRVQRGRRAAR